MRSKPLGDWGERLAADHLSRQGWTIHDRNFRVGRKEIDLIAERAGVLAFIEVKVRTGAGFGHPLEAVTWRKRREIGQVATGWIDRFGHEGLTYRFDAIAVTRAPGGKATLEHVENAWRLDGS